MKSACGYFLEKEILPEYLPCWYRLLTPASHGLQIQDGNRL